MKTQLSIDGQTLTHFQKTRALKEPIDFLGWLENTPFFPKFYFKKGNREYAAAGSLLELDHAPAFDESNTSPLRFYGGQSFFPELPYKDKNWESFPRRLFFAPKWELVCEDGKITQLAHSLEKEPSLPGIHTALSSSVHFSDPSHLPTKEKWIELLKKIQHSKVVMARRTTCALEKGGAFGLAAQLQRHQKNACIFLVQFAKGKAFVGATPEHLFWREDSQLFSEAIAGTRPIGKDLEQELVNCPKEQREFAFVTRSIEEALRSLVEALQWEKQRVLKTNTVQHLHRRCTATLRENVSDQQILDALHPTAAMGGTPRKAALQFLRDHEPFERGWYASPLGFTSHKWAEFAVGIRSALVEEKALHLFAGAGIVEGSEPLKEWNELNHKMKTLYSN